MNYESTYLLTILIRLHAWGRLEQKNELGETD